MALNILNHTPRRDLENITSKVVSVKSFGAAKGQSALKKTALVDVKNTIHKKVISSASKPSSSSKTALKQNDFGNKENINVGGKQMKPKEATPILLLNEAVEVPNMEEENAAPCCQCYDICEDDFADIMFKDIRPSKPLIEDLAMVWENRYIPNVDDKRNILENLKPIDLSDVDDDIFRNFLEEDLKSMEDIGINDVPPPFF